MRAGMGARMGLHLGGVHAFNDAPHLSTAATFCLIGSPTWWELSAAWATPSPQTVSGA